MGTRPRRSPRNIYNVVCFLTLCSFISAWGSLTYVWLGQGLGQLMAQLEEEDLHLSKKFVDSASTSEHHKRQNGVILCGSRGTRMLLDKYRTLWTAGWNARHTEYYAQAPPAISWSQEAESLLETHYRRLHFPPNCSAVNGWVVVAPFPWGLASAARDFQSEVVRALAQNYTLVHDGSYAFCPERPDRFLNCFWEDFNSCQEGWKECRDRPTIARSWQDVIQAVQPHEFPEWIWQAMRRAGHITIRDSMDGHVIADDTAIDAGLYHQLKLSTLRAMLSKVVFRPRQHIKARARDMVAEWRRNGTYVDDNKERPGLLVHLRRTDKKEDLGPHWASINFASARHMGPLLQQMEATLDQSFRHLFIMSDDPHMLHRAADELGFFFGSPTSVLFSNSLCHMLGSNNDTYTGHESLGDRGRHDLYALLVSEVYAAIQVSDYMIGSGSCGVSQFIAWNLGAKHRFEPSMTAFWEEDLIVRDCRVLTEVMVETDPNCSGRSHHPVSETAMAASHDRHLMRKQWEQKRCSLFTPGKPRCLKMQEALTT